MLHSAIHAQDGTVKYLYGLSDKRAVETVLVPFVTRDAVCISSQVGCAMGCRFCHTGQQGLTRHLTAEEIISQYQSVWDWLRTHRPTRPRPNVVFMGQGEPLHNFEETKRAIQWMLDPKRCGLGPRNITVSTAGHLTGIQRFAELGGVNFALSLHSPFEAERSELIPLNDRWPLEELIPAIRRIPLRRRQFINCEYLVIGRRNHTRDHAEGLALILKSMPVLINLIPFNPYPGAPYQRPSLADIEDFKKELIRVGLRTFTRTTKGSDIMAACGQLNTEVHA
jgi:23S rRNA (adenine2503-C2)-methyltransferase